MPKNFKFSFVIWFFLYSSAFVSRLVCCIWFHIPQFQLTFVKSSQKHLSAEIDPRPPLWERAVGWSCRLGGNWHQGSSWHFIFLQDMGFPSTPLIETPVHMVPEFEKFKAIKFFLSSAWDTLVFSCRSDAIRLKCWAVIFWW